LFSLSECCRGRITREIWNDLWETYQKELSSGTKGLSGESQLVEYLDKYFKKIEKSE